MTMFNVMGEVSGASDLRTEHSRLLQVKACSGWAGSACYNTSSHPS